MKIGIDAYEANVVQRVGIGRYAFELINALYQLKTAHEFVLFVPNKKATDLPASRKGWEYREVKNARLWTYVSLPLALGKEACDVVFSPTHYVPFFTSVPRVFSLMDLSYIYFPELFRLKDRFKLRFGTRHSVSVAKRICTISAFSKNAIMNYYGVSGNQISVTYPGIDHDLFFLQVDKKKIKEVQSKYAIDNGYILFVGTLQPRKNIVRLLEAFKKLNRNTLKLLIIGKKGWLYNIFFEKAEELGLNGKVVFTDFVDDRELALLYSGAVCLVLPSLYEGFGIPAIEAMASGVPVVVSNVSSLPEIVGDAGILVDPYSVESITGGIEKVLAFSSKEREMLVKKGFVQSKRFNWVDCAKNTIQCLEEAI